MDEISKNKPKKHICAGLLAHVDAGKTTLAESLLFLSGSIRKAGRVDHQDAYLDTHALERSRGITIFSKQAQIHWEDMDVTLLDTPGHVDFSAEMERTLQVLDYAILVISGADGVQGHTLTLWRLLERYRIPVFLFVNKMDQDGTDRQKLMEEIQRELSGSCIDFTARDTEWMESVALCEETLMQEYLETEHIPEQAVAGLIQKRQIFPCYFGSALKMQGVEALLDGLRRETVMPEYQAAFGARIFKIARDEQNMRLTYMKITGGTLPVRTALTPEEKVNQIRIYSGEKYETVQEATPGMVCAVTGLVHTFAGECLGCEQGTYTPMLEPVLTYKVNLPADCNIPEMLEKLRRLEEEEPELHIMWNEELQEIQAQVMGEVQIEIVKSLIAERFGTEVSFDSGNIVYKETITEPVEGVGHFEPLRHYAEVHLLLEPGKAGSGMQFDTVCSEDVLDKNWQRLIMTHLAEREHRGVLTGSMITDMKITILTGRAHDKHTEGGDFRQATYRAIRQGLRKAENILLEPYYQFRLDVPQEMLGRALTDMERMQGSVEPPVIENGRAVLKGYAPVAVMRSYPMEVIAYTRGAGQLSCMPGGYRPCKNAEEVIDACGYDADADVGNPTGSVFCAHGAGYYVPWDEVEAHMHLPYVWEKKRQKPQGNVTEPVRHTMSDAYATDKELAAIFAKTYGEPKTKLADTTRRVYGKRSGSENPVTKIYTEKKQIDKEQYLLVDGYNIIFAWEELSELAKYSLDGARDALMDMLSNYQGYKKCHLILVFDAYKVKGNPETVLQYHNIQIVYTKEAQTADAYIEKFAHEMGRKHDVVVATSDGLEQIIILGQGCRLFSARELKEELERTNEEVRSQFPKQTRSHRNYLFDWLSDDLAEKLEQIRLHGDENNERN
ncbi:MAG: TetM/TetW/TetO/TetS family tetracycline resistance ribosomal protection protein [Lachnospiraceae bacterium]|nr:TetM/TetW/TetO/TetS family tetracycline resistance ribosomal protection protein [Lachnospiraceae bacterium]